MEESNVKESGSLFHVIAALKTQSNFMIIYANPSNHRSLSPQRNITISNPISSGIGMETVSGRRCSTAMLTINLTFHSTPVATSQQIPASLWARATCCLPFITETLFTPSKNQILSVEMIRISLITLLPGSNPLPATKQPKSGSK